jgi:nitrogen regulatory protein PII 1
MKLIRAIIRPDKTETVVDALDAAGYVALTRMDVVGRGKQKGIRVGDIHYDELPKTMLMIAAEDPDVGKIIALISASAKTGNFGDGKIFVAPLEQSYTIRTGAEGI